MTTEDIIIHIFYLVEEEMNAEKRGPQTHLYPSKMVTIGILFALKGEHFRAFYFSMLTAVCKAKKMHQRVHAYLEARLAYMAAMFNILTTLFRQLHPDVDPAKLSIAEFSL